MKITKDLTSVNRTIYKHRKIKYIVLHYFGALSSAKNNCIFFRDTYRKSSAHYFVDDDGVWQCVEDDNAAWHCGDDGSGEYKGVATNFNSIGIEIRPYKIDIKSVESEDKDWFFHEQTLDNTIELVKYLMNRYHIEADHVIRHYDVTAKWCPRPFVGKDINEYYNKTGNQMWSNFKARLSKGEDEVTQEEFNEKMKVYMTSIEDDEPFAWSEESRVWAEKNGLITGNEDGEKQYKMPVTREQLVVFMKRLHELD